MIRDLDPRADRDALADLLARAADCVRLAISRLPDEASVDALLTDAPPGIDPATPARLGAWEDDCLLGVCDLASGHPSPDDAYIGLMLVAMRCAGAGWGGRSSTRWRGGPPRAGPRGSSLPC